MEKTQDQVVEEQTEKTWRKYYYPGEHLACPWLDNFNFYKCVLKVTA